MARLNLHPDVKAALNRHIDTAMARMQQPKYRQEPNFMVTLIGKLDGVVYDGAHGRLELVGVPVDDRGRGAAESTSGADFALTAVVTIDGVSTTKAVLGQAKGGDVDHLSAVERHRLNGQVRKMRERTKHYVVVETPTAPTETVAVRRSKLSDPQFRHARQTLADYLELMIACRHGDTRKGFAAAVMNDSSLARLKVSYTVPEDDADARRSS
jgi:hypothetical protein